MAELIIEQPREEGDRVELAARFVSAAGEHRLWYRVESAHRDLLPDNADPFVLGTTHLAMKTGENVLVRGQVSPSLLENLEVLQQAWSTWRPKTYRRVEVRATIEAEPEAPARDGAISGFSGGVDSCFTAFRHARGVTTRFPQPLRASVMVHGFDIPLDDEEGYRRATAKAERQLARLGLELFRACHQLAGAARQLDRLVRGGGGFGPVALPGRVSGRPPGLGRTVRRLPLSRRRVEPPHRPTALQRCLQDRSRRPWLPTHRQDRQLLPSGRRAIDDLRVCWRNPVRHENCCVCEKCIRNILSFRALGLERPACFPRDVSNRQIMGLVPIKQIMIDVGYASIERTRDRAAASARPPGSGPCARPSARARCTTGSARSGAVAERGGSCMASAWWDEVVRVLLLNDNRAHPNWGAQATPHAIDALFEATLPDWERSWLSWDWLRSRHRRLRSPLPSWTYDPARVGIGRRMLALSVAQH